MVAGLAVAVGGMAPVGGRVVRHSPGGSSPEALGIHTHPIVN